MAEQESKKQGSCPIDGTMCPEHLFEHGKEAEELRAGIEGILEEYEERGEQSRRIRQALQKLLDETDARDSLAWVETQPPRKQGA